MPKILFAVDGSEASLRAALGLAGILRWWKATDVEVLNVQPESLIFSELVPQSLRERAESRVREGGERALATAHELLQGAAADARPHCGSVTPRRRSPARLRCSIAR